MAQDIWGTFVDTASDIIDSIGTNAQTSAEFEAAKAAALKARTALSAAETTAKIEQQKRRDELIQNIFLALFAVVFIAIAGNLYLKLKK